MAIKINVGNKNKASKIDDVEVKKPAPEDPPKVEKITCEANKEIQHHSGATINESENVELFLPEKLQNQVGSVSFEGGFTKNMGDFNSTKCSLSISMPCNPTKDGVEKTYDILNQWVNEKLQSIYEDLEA